MEHFLVPKQYEKQDNCYGVLAFETALVQGPGPEQGIVRPILNALERCRVAKSADTRQCMKDFDYRMQEVAYDFDLAFGGCDVQQHSGQVQAVPHDMKGWFAAFDALKPHGIDVVVRNLTKHLTLDEDITRAAHRAPIDAEHNARYVNARKKLSNIKEQDNLPLIIDLAEGYSTPKVVGDNHFRFSYDNESKHFLAQAIADGIVENVARRHVLTDHARDEAKRQKTLATLRFLPLPLRRLVCASRFRFE